MKTYIGDGIYAELNDQGLILTTENGIETTNRIVIEPREWETLNRWLSVHSVILTIPLPDKVQEQDHFPPTDDSGHRVT